MEARLEVKAKKRRASVFDTYLHQTKYYLNLGISLSTIFKIISKDMLIKYSYIGFYAWAKKMDLQIQSRRTKRNL